jgi:hypothetical protein
MRRWLVPVLVGVLFGCAARAQQPASAPGRTFDTYKLTFTVTELNDGKPVNTRTYDMVLQEGRGKAWGAIRLGNRVPVNMGEKGPQYLDVGLSVDAGLERPVETAPPTLDVRFELSSAVPDDQRSTTAGPVLRSVKFSGATELTVGRPILLGSGEDMNSNRRFQLAVAATRAK